MSIARDVIRSTRGRVVLAVIAVWAAFQGWLSIEAPGKISKELAGASDKVNIQIDMPFTPERFHVLAFQKYGRIAGADDHSIGLRGVKRTDLNAVARPYWVTSVGPIKEED
ncbi:hypothetical protein AB7813_26700 [Tardiphaga sp. 20_F10_N6_6]|jgi:hypothetical protein|uniref:Uncharacterized protein n=1 Tax=Tardiphaga robiniae TaxID=943830 RepID=A0A7G6U7U9_9BRAD|nr:MULTISPECIES: hypothetical protein [Nitrobacteraceae]MDR6662067.1 hypothetical protein [Tardiphaga robiniae]NUU42388.1 hypothetical protein [Tardiphaga robiniae]QND75081.1 hypothetical protein HB776_30580 [Tardiphaga robiniae]UFS74063.1 hypothetical protein LPB73_19325 [Tardiphaga sp. 37S4]WPO43619.1 hypothetical protein SFY93_10905 [Tardiphaga sp. 42S5]